MDNAESLFVSGASFRGVSTCVRRLKLMSDAANDISAVVRSQYEEFSELSEVEFDGRYKVRWNQTNAFPSATMLMPMEHSRRFRKSLMVTVAMY